MHVAETVVSRGAKVHTEQKSSLYVGGDTTRVGGINRSVADCTGYTSANGTVVGVGGIRAHCVR